MKRECEILGYPEIIEESIFVQSSIETAIEMALSIRKKPARTSFPLGMGNRWSVSVCVDQGGVIKQNGHRYKQKKVIVEIIDHEDLQVWRFECGVVRCNKVRDKEEFSKYFANDIIQTLRSLKTEEDTAV